MRSETLTQIAKLIASKKHDSNRVLLVGIDGNDGSGKSHFARESSGFLKINDI